jgi:hypothetical protein
MSKRMSLIALILLSFALSWAGIQRAVSQQDDERKQTLVIAYPNPFITISGTTTKYAGLIYVKVYPISPGLVKKYGAGPVATAELSASQRDVVLLPLGEYEVHYAMRTGSELKTFILKDIILRPDRATGLLVEMNADAKTTIIGGDMSLQQIEGGLRQLQSEVSELKQEVARLKQKGL